MYPTRTTSMSEIVATDSRFTVHSNGAVSGVVGGAVSSAANQLDLRVDVTVTVDPPDAFHRPHSFFHYHLVSPSSSIPNGCDDVCPPRTHLASTRSSRVLPSLI